MYLTHVTTEGERWDSIAYKYYGDALGYERVIAANPHAPILPVLPAGLTLSIPLIAAQATITDLPPWMR
jgi:phage tail protein X